jgi:hypothetical protein
MPGWLSALSLGTKSRFWGDADGRLCFWGSVFYTARMLLNSSDDADLTPEEQSEAGHTFQGTESEIETKSEAARVGPATEVHVVEAHVEADPKPEVPAAETSAALA